MLGFVLFIYSRQGVTPKRWENIMMFVGRGCVEWVVLSVRRGITCKLEVDVA